MSWVEDTVNHIADVGEEGVAREAMRLAIEEAARRLAIEIPVTGRPGYADRAHANILAMLVDADPQQPEVKR